MGQVVHQGRLLAAGGLVIMNRLPELGQIVQPVLRAFRPEHALVAASLQHLAKQFGDLTAVVTVEGMHEVDESGCTGTLEERLFKVRLKSLI